MLVSESNVGAQNPQGGCSEPTKQPNVGAQNQQGGASMTSTRPHWTTAQVLDILPVDVDVHAVGGLVDLYLDTNSPTYQRIRLTAEQAIQLAYQLNEQLSKGNQ